MALKVSGGGASEPAMTTGRIIDVRDRYDVDSSKPLPALDSQPAVAYHCLHKRDSKRALYALICDPKLPPRLEAVGMMRRIDHRSLVRCLDWDVIDWPPEGRRCPVVVMERPGGERVFTNLETPRAPMQEELVTRHFIDPATQILREMHGFGLYHRMLRPDNLFYRGPEKQEMMIGECFSSLPGITNPIAYETLECSLATAAGRGEGGSENDLYALGVTILALLTGNSPLVGYTDEEILRLKLTMGSYGALVQNHRVSLTMMEPLRGLLNDDPAERWTLDELGLWLNGRRLSPKQQTMPSKGSRGLTIAGKDYSTAREVANAMHKNWDQAAILINSGALDTWLRRSLGEEDRIEAVNLAKSGGSDNQDRLIARILIALDPEGPIRLKELSATVDGIGTFIASFAEESSARQLFNSVLSMGLVSFWMEQQKKLHPTHLRNTNRLDKVRAVLNQTTLGFGIERVIYELNSSMPCQSTLFERDYIPSVDHLVPAFERLCMGDSPPKRLIDRHIAAFLGTGFKRAIGGELRDIDRGADEEEGRLAQVKILASLQDTMHRNIKFPHLCETSAKLLEPAINRFFSRDRRKKVRGKLRKAAKSGRMQELLDVIDDTKEVSEDKTEFDHASMQYARTTHDLIALMRDIHNKELLAEEYGGQLASATSLLCCVAAITLAGFWAFI